MYDLDLSLNRVYWEYLQTGTHMRPDHGYWGDEYIPTLGVRASITSKLLLSETLLTRGEMVNISGPIPSIGDIRPPRTW